MSITSNTIQTAIVITSKPMLSNTYKTHIKFSQNTAYEKQIIREFFLDVSTTVTSFNTDNTFQPSHLKYHNAVLPDLPCTTIGRYMRYVTVRKNANETECNNHNCRSDNCYCYSK